MSTRSSKLSDKSKRIILGRAEQLTELETPAKLVAEEEPEEQETIFIEFSTLRLSAGAGEPLIDDSYLPILSKSKRAILPKKLILLLKLMAKV